MMIRAGLVGWCDREGVPSAAIRAVTGHQSEAMMDSYSRPADLFAHSAGAYVATSDRAMKDCRYRELRVAKSFPQAFAWPVGVLVHPRGLFDAQPSTRMGRFGSEMWHL